MYNQLPSFVIGFHGCDIDTKKRILETNTMTASVNSYDWIGHGVYFWEQNKQRAEEFAIEALKRPKITKGTIKEPAVIGAVIDLGNRLNLLDSEKIGRVEDAYRVYIAVCKAAGREPEQNIGAKRNLDCSVIEMVHRITNLSKLKPYDTVRAMYIEGDPLYENAGFYNKSHIQICVRNMNCIKAFFDPRDKNAIEGTAW